MYWIPVFELLEAKGFQVQLVEPGKLKGGSGRKTDILDGQGIQQRHTYGLLSGSFGPEDELCALRSSMRGRSMLVKPAGQHAITEITGSTGLQILDAILAGPGAPR